MTGEYMIQDTLQEKIKDALKSRDAVRVSTLRLLLSALKYEAINKMHDLSEGEELVIVRRQLKQREEAIAALRQAQGKPTSPNESTLETRIAQERQEAEILKEYLPAQMSEEEIGELVDRVIGEMGTVTQADFGKVMQAAVACVAGRADGKTVSQVVKSKLQ